ncbi:hypothetical protein Z946_625 [Sulfitobacter noctilucicola]|uniref:Uncharacterized protein n=1 Tax=Sulfitobacter noctilucicola TaxID=1342301 RepID=A0A7W6MBQ8_9RHOB|nr:hypothetical protein [Sulfitobacter noctilucicola]KIN66146.1 hypothetical protein Z946_625 [Sulfitobacter noctilucicola]MBB4175827.1 hypothetical protein [Sulfitobacter noctilucicola]
MITPDQDAWLKATFNINVKHAEVDTDVTTEQGMKPKARLDEYEGEFEKAGWRNKANPDSTVSMTRKLTDEEAEKQTYSTNAEGKLVDKDGNEIKDDKKRLMTMSPDSGDITIGNDEHVILRELNPDGSPTDRYQTMPRAQALQMAKASGGTKRVEYQHHSTGAQGKDVASAGHIDTKDGKVTRIDNSSGHYRPAFEHLLQAVEHLLKTGAMLDTTIVDKDGNELEDSNPKAFKLYQKTQILIQGLNADKAVLVKLADAADKGGDPAKLQAAKETYDKKVKTITAALDAMKKMGIGPANKITGEVEFTYADASGTALEFITSVEEEKLSTKEFLMGKGAEQGIERLNEDDDEEDEDDVLGRLGIEAYGDKGSGIDDTTTKPDPSYPYQNEPTPPPSEGVGQDDNPYPYLTSGPNSPDHEGGNDTPKPDQPEEPALGGTSSDPSGGQDNAVRQTPFRDFDDKEDMLEELKRVAAEKKLRPEDRENAAELIKEGVAPDIDEDKWQESVEELLSTAKGLLRDDDDDDDDDDDEEEDFFKIENGKVVRVDAETLYTTEICDAEPDMEIRDGKVVRISDSGVAYMVDPDDL